MEVLDISILLSNSVFFFNPLNFKGINLVTRFLCHFLSLPQTSWSGIPGWWFLRFTKQKLLTTRSNVRKVSILLCCYSYLTKHLGFDGIPVTWLTLSAHIDRDVIKSDISTLLLTISFVPRRWLQWQMEFPKTRWWDHHVTSETLAFVSLLSVAAKNSEELSSFKWPTSEDMNLVLTSETSRVLWGQSNDWLVEVSCDVRSWAVLSSC